MHFALVSMPLVELITNGLNDVTKTSDIRKVYIIDETGFLKQIIVVYLKNMRNTKI